jgi:4a-hydroxytetrahydrobiopterin dehydratase
MPASPLSRKRIISCVLMNLLATPGLGSFVARRRVAGTGQILLSLAGFGLLMVWFYKLVIVQYYGQITGNVTVEPVGWIAVTGGVLFLLAWLWSLVTSISLLRQESQRSTEAIRSFSAGLAKLDEPAIVSGLAYLPEWTRYGETISRTFVLKDFAAAMKFVNAVAEYAERVQHHPDVDIRWNKVTLALTTHDAGGLTEKDFAFARACDEQGRMQQEA